MRFFAQKTKQNAAASKKQAYRGKENEGERSSAKAASNMSARYDRPTILTRIGYRCATWRMSWRIPMNYNNNHKVFRHSHPSLYAFWDVPWVPKYACVHFKQDVDPFSRFCADKLTSRYGIIVRNRPHIMLSLWPMTKQESYTRSPARESVLFCT